MENGIKNSPGKILVINQFDAKNPILQVYYMPLHVSSTMCSSSGGQNCIIQPLVSSQLYVTVPCTGKTRFCASSWLITKIILRCTVSKTSKSPGKIFGAKYCLFTLYLNLVALAIQLEEMGRYAQNFAFLYDLKKFKEMKREYLKTQCIIQHTLLSDEGSHDVNSVDISLNFEFYGKHL